jgi:hypothetical protein
MSDPAEHIAPERSYESFARFVKRTEMEEASVTKTPSF